MMNYEFFTASDFLGDPHFRKWVLENDAESAAFWTGWQHQNPGKLEEIEEAKAMLYALQERSYVPENGEIEKEVAKTLAHIGHEGTDTARHPAAVRKIYYLLTAACVAVLLLTGKFWSDADVSLPTEVNNRAVSNLVVVRSQEKKQTVHLQDGSTIILSPESELSYPELFGASSREVSLKGEAYFEIARDSRRPFRVLATDFITEVLGTSFTIRSFESLPEASVTVKSGKVSVVSSAESPRGNQTGKAQKIGMILSANQEAIYSRNEAKLVKKLATNPERVVIIPPSDLIFDDEPVVNVLNKVAAQYGINIVYNKELLAGCILTGDLTDHTLYEQLSLICRLTGSEYDLVEGQVIIRSSGCSETS